MWLYVGLPIRDVVNPDNLNPLTLADVNNFHAEFSITAVPNPMNNEIGVVANQNGQVNTVRSSKYER